MPMSPDFLPRTLLLVLLMVPFTLWLRRQGMRRWEEIILVILVLVAFQLLWDWVLWDLLT
ncbi:hypothetical protein DEDE109153_09655 [Deinococcus deserti]|uniref:hypothetical protein n=1 Tax=Deinococcus deserti TaxID=310783 RepID=UPI00059E957A